MGERSSRIWVAGCKRGSGVVLYPVYVYPATFYLQGEELPVPSSMKVARY
jgi:hypothetical protein